MSIINMVLEKFMKMNPSYEKETYRGAIKQFMKRNGLRTISLENHNKFLNRTTPNGVHSIKLDLQDGYMNIYGYDENGRCGDVINNASSELYKEVFNQFNEILEEEIPYKERRNILVRMSR